MKKHKRNIIPVGIFFLIFFIFMLLSAAGTAVYFYYTAKNNINDIEINTHSYSEMIAEAFGEVAELCFPGKDYTKLKQLFHVKIKEELISEAFFVLDTGKIVVHSDKDITKKLEGYIVTDEFKYNTDLIFYPLKDKSRETFILDYNILDKKIPFNAYQKRFLKKYIYSKIDIPGWLVTRGVYYKDRPVGTINFIIGKDRIYDSIFQAADDCIKISIALTAISFIVALFLSLVIFVRYRKISMRSASAESQGQRPVVFNSFFDRGTGGPGSLKEEKVLDISGEDFIIQEIDTGRVPIDIISNQKNIDTGKSIKDAIPVRRR